MERCATCRHWGAEPSDRADWQSDKLGFKLCERVQPRWKLEDQVPDHIRANQWDDDTAEALYNKATLAVFSKHPAYVQDGSEYMAELITAPSFGCILHEPTETP